MLIAPKFTRNSIVRVDEPYIQSLMPFSAISEDRYKISGCKYFLCFMV